MQILSSAAEMADKTKPAVQLWLCFSGSWTHVGFSSLQSKLSGMTTSLVTDLHGSIFGISDSPLSKSFFAAAIVESFYDENKG